MSPRREPVQPWRPPRFRPGFKRDLYGEASPAPHWRESVDGRAPRLGPDEVIGPGMTRRGIFEGRDPMRFPAMWSRVRWSALLLWAGVVGGTIWKAWRDHGGLPDPDA